MGDTTFSEVVQEYGSTEGQLVLDKINSWAFANDTRLNLRKCEEIIISFSRAQDFPPALSTDDMPLERVECHNVLQPWPKLLNTL